MIVPNVLVVNPELPAKNVQELVALLKAEPDKYSYASSGIGTPLHLSGELFKIMAGVEMQHIPYKGAGPALNDVIANQVPIMFDNLPSSSSHIKGGTLKALGVTTAKRVPSFPDLPTIANPACRAMKPTPGMRCLHRPARRRKSSTASTHRLTRR